MTNMTLACSHADAHFIETVTLAVYEVRLVLLDIDSCEFLMGGDHYSKIEIGHRVSSERPRALMALCFAYCFLIKALIFLLSLSL